MKKWNELMEYIDDYVYDNENEEVVVRNSNRVHEAQKIYDECRDYVGDEESSKWMFDIALDCIRCMSLEKRTYLTKHMNTTEHHLGYAMYVRNKYIHVSKKHCSVNADGISSIIMKMIFSIISPIYDYRNSKCVEFFQDFTVQQIMKRYGNSYESTINEFIYNELSDTYLTDKEDLVEQFRNKMRLKVGSEEFIRIFKEAYQEYYVTMKKRELDDWYWYINFPAVKAVLFPIEATQVYILLKIQFFFYIERGYLKSLDECRSFIDKHLGLSDEYADFMARCGWETCGHF